MDLFKLFRPREAATFAAEPINPVVLPGADACNCPDVLFDGDQSGEVKTLLSGDNVSKRQGHKIVSDKIDSLLFGEDREAAANQLGQMKRTQPVPNPSEETKRHLLMHIDGAGKSHRDYGIKDSELSPTYIAGRNLANEAQGAIAPTDYSADNCGTCSQYETALKGHAHKLYSAMNQGIENLPEVQRPYAQLSAKGLFQRMWDSWTNREPVKEGDHPLVQEGNDILNNWNNHTETGHGFSLDPYSFVKHTPIVAGEEGGKARLHGLYRKLKDLRPGWSTQRRIDIPSRGIGEETEKQLAEMYPENPDQDVSTRGILPRVTPAEHSQALDLAEKMKERGELNQFVMADENPTVRATDASLPQSGTFYDKPIGLERKMVEIHPTNYDMGGAPITPAEVYETENLTGVGRGPNYMITKKPQEFEQTYNPLIPTLNERGEEVDPRAHWMTRPVKYDTDRPEIVQTYSTHLDENGVCQHPSHAVKLAPGVKYTDEEVAAKQAQEQKNRTSCATVATLPTGEQNVVAKGLHPDDINDLYSIPREDAYLFQKARVKPDLALHKENRRSFEPTAENKRKAAENYNASYNQALATAYPDMSRDEALDSLYAEHQAKIKDLASRTEKFRTSSKKEDNMFNSSNSKEAHLDLGTIIDGVKAVGHAAEHGAHAVGDWASRIINDMAHPSKEVFSGNPKKLHELQNVANEFKGMESQGGMGRTIAEQNLQGFTDANTHEQFNGVGTALDSAAALSGLAAFHNLTKKKSSFEDRYAAASKKPCEKCGKNCANDVECKQNVQDRRREQAANSAYEDQ